MSASRSPRSTVSDRSCRTWRCAVVAVDVAEGQHLAPARLTRRKAEADAALGARRTDPFDLQPRQQLLAALRHGRPVAFLVATDVGLDPLDLLLLALRLVFQRRVAARPLDPIGGIVAGKTLHPAIAQLQHALGDRVEEIAIVADDQLGRAGSLGIALEPLRGGEVQMVGRLVHEQHVRTREQQPGQRDPHAPATRELHCRPVAVSIREAEAGEHAAHLGLDRVAAAPLELLLELGMAMHDLLELGFVELQLVDLTLERAQLLLDGVQVGHRAQHLVVERALGGEIGILGQITAHGAPAERHAARVRRFEPGQEAKQRRLAGAVGANQRYPLTRLQPQAGAVEHPPPTVFFHQSLRAYLGHGRAKWYGSTCARAVAIGI